MVGKCEWSETRYHLFRNSIQKVEKEMEKMKSTTTNRYTSCPNCVSQHSTYEDECYHTSP